MVASVTFPSPGFLGLNKSKAQSVVGPEWATVASNCVIDSEGRLASRKGWVLVTETPISGTPRLDTLHEYIDGAGATTLIAAGGNKLWESSDDGATWTDRTGSLTITSDHWQFVNFNGKVLGACIGHPLVVKTTGNFAAVTENSATLPDDPVAILAAFGRIWAIDADLQTVRYSALLDETRWHADDGGGIIDMRNVWPQGMDEATTLASFGGRLWVFGKRQIIAWSDGQGSELGVDPTQLYVEDTIENAGCVARDSLSRIGEGDLVFLSQNGVRSLTRTLQEKQTPISALTRNSLDYLNELLLTGDLTKVRGAYSPLDSFYLLSHPDSEVTICFDMRLPLQDGTYRVFEWPDFSPGGMCSRLSGDLLFGFDGVVGRHDGYLDNEDAYVLTFRSGWLDLGEDNAVLKFLKRIKLTAAIPPGYSTTVGWSWDFSPNAKTAVVSNSGAFITSSWGAGLWGQALWGGARSYRDILIPASGSGQFFRVQIQVTIDNFPFAIHSLTSYYDKGRFA